MYCDYEKVLNMSNYKWLWIDCEMTGLDVNSELLLEVACYISDKSLEDILEGPDLIIHQPIEVLESMSEWCTDHHKESGLWDASLKSQIDVAQAETSMIEFLDTIDKSKSDWVLAGNSVHHDKNFLHRFMPLLMQRCHYQILDVSSIAIMMRSWLKTQAFKKKQSHRAQDDILESIEELKFYKNQLCDISE